MSADAQIGRTALREDLELTPEAAGLVRGGVFYPGPGEEDPWSLGRLARVKGKKAARRHYRGGGRPV